MRIFRCRICGTSCLAMERPSPCGFCGAGSRFVVPAADFRPTPLGELTAGSRSHLQRLLETGVDESAFHHAASKVAESEEDRALFRALARIVSEQVLVLSTLLADGEPPEELFETGSCSPSHRKNLQEASHRAEKTLEICRVALADAEEDRVREVLEALAGSRQDHLGLLHD